MPEVRAAASASSAELRISSRSHRTSGQCLALEHAPSPTVKARRAGARPCARASPKARKASSQRCASSPAFTRALKATWPGRSRYCHCMAPSNFAAILQALPLPQAEIEVLSVTTSGNSAPRPISARRPKAPCQLWPRSHAATAALKLTTSRARRRTGMAFSSCKACSHCLPRSQALIAAFQSVASGMRKAHPSACRRNCNAACQC
mmetsp:Transcript_3601/g.11241  ORF Transcript_3601/g.11241 Transcript_3601/m.11241 type:complete len:206 (+) Transcript_3601:454-1071(+)